MVLACLIEKANERFLCWKHSITCGQTRKHCLRNKNVSEFVGKHFCFLGSKFGSRNNVYRGGQIGKHYLIGNIMFPRQCFLVCPGLYMLQNKQSHRHSFCGVMSHVVLFAYRIMLNISTRNRATKIVQIKEVIS